MDEIIYKFFLAGNRFMLEIHLRKPEFIYSACDQFTKNKEIKKNFKRNKRFKI